MSYPFEQLPKESAKAFEAFSLYLSLGPERSLATVGQKLGKSEGLIERWSAKFDWPSRVQAHGAHLAVIERKAVEVMAQGKAVDWAMRRELLLETEWEMHKKCIEAAKKALATFMERDKSWANLADIARVLEVASKLGRLSSGLSTERTEVTGGRPLRVEFIQALDRVYGPTVEAEVIEVTALPDKSQSAQTTI